jgi:choline-sulfatase
MCQNKWIWVAVVCAIMAFNVSCNPAPDPKQNGSNARPNVVVLLVDTLRYDAISAYGGEYPTPAMDELARLGVSFTNTFAPCSWTVPSVASILLGMYPQTHGLTEGLVSKGKVLRQQRVPKKYDTLAELFRKAGYQTFGVTANAHMEPVYGYGDGFDNYKVHWFKSAGAVEKTVRSWKKALKQASDTTGYFLYVHWFDPHFPYSPRKPMIQNLIPGYFADAPQTEEDFTANQLRKMGAQKFYGGRTLEEVKPEQLKAAGYFEKHPDRLEMLKKLYAGEVLHTDRSLAKVVRMIPDLRRSLIVLTSDHGEAFDEHNSMIHGIDLYQETVHVPLVFKFPEGKGSGVHIDTPVSLVDIAPTLLSFAGIKPNEQHEGVDLTTLTTGEKIAPRKLWSHVNRINRHRWRAVIQDRYKLAAKLPFNIGKNKKADSAAQNWKYYLFDLAADPKEMTNLAETNEELTSNLKQILEAEMSKEPSIKPKVLKNQAKHGDENAFRAVGYL